MKQILTIIMVMFCVTASAQKTVVAVYAANMGKCGSNQTHSSGKTFDDFAWWKKQL